DATQLWDKNDNIVRLCYVAYTLEELRLESSPTRIQQILYSKIKSDFVRRVYSARERQSDGKKPFIPSYYLVDEGDLVDGLDEEAAEIYRNLTKPN
ncbi:MAG: hypothetical protein AAFZ74_18305, partial [Pseudomonadota bacterium]